MSHPGFLVYRSVQPDRAGSAGVPGAVIPPEDIPAVAAGLRSVLDAWAADGHARKDRTTP